MQHFMDFMVKGKRHVKIIIKVTEKCNDERQQPITLCFSCD